MNACKAPLINGLIAAVDSQDTLVNIDAGDYSQSTGLALNGTDEYINTGVAANTTLGSLTDNSISYSVYIRNGSDEAKATMSCFAGALANSLLISFVGTSVWDCNNSGTQRAVVADSAGTGMYVGSRTATNSSLLYKNSSTIATNTVTGGTRTAASIYVFASNDNGSASLFTTRAMEQYAIAVGLTATDVANFTARYATLRTALGR